MRKEKKTYVCEMFYVRKEKVSKEKEACSTSAFVRDNVRK